MFVLGAAGNVIVFGVVKRNGHVKAMPIAAHNQVEVMRELQAHTREVSKLLTILSTTEISPILVRKASGLPSLKHGITRATNCNCRSKCGGVTVNELKQMKRQADGLGRFRRLPV